MTSLRDVDTTPDVDTAGTTVHISGKYVTMSWDIDSYSFELTRGETQGLIDDLEAALEKIKAK